MYISIISLKGEELHREMECQDMQLANTALSVMEVLIGGDHYWEIVSVKLECLFESVVALTCEFGQFIQGPVSRLNAT